MDDPHVLIEHARDHAHGGRYEEAIACYERAIAIAPEHAAHRLTIAELYFELQRYDDATLSAEAHLALAPLDPRGWEALGRAHHLAGRARQAAEALERAVAIAPAWGEALYHAALAWADLGRDLEAEDRLRRAIELDARYAPLAADEGLLERYPGAVMAR